MSDDPNRTPANDPPPADPPPADPPPAKQAPPGQPRTTLNTSTDSVDKMTLTAARNEVKRLRAQLEEQGDQNAGERYRKAPQPASYGLSEGERMDLEQQGFTTSPFTGKLITVLDSDVDVEPGSDAARRGAERAVELRKQRDADARRA